MVADFVGGQFGHLMYWWEVWSFYVLVGDFSLGEMGVDNFPLGDLSCSLFYISLPFSNLD